MSDYRKQVDVQTTLRQKIIGQIKKKLNILRLDSHSQIWDWQLGGCRSEYYIPFSGWQDTFRCIWKDDYSWNGGTWIDDPESNTQNITEDTKLNFLSKCIESWYLCFKPLLSKRPEI